MSLWIGSQDCRTYCKSLVPDGTKDNGKAIRQVCREFIELCRRLELFTQAVVAIDGSKFKAVNSKERNDARASRKRRIAQVEQHIERYLSLLDEADRAAPPVRDTKVPDLKEKIASLKAEMRRLKKREREVLAHPDKQPSETDPDARLMRKGGMGSQVKLQHPKRPISTTMGAYAGYAIGYAYGFYRRSGLGKLGDGG